MAIEILSQSMTCCSSGLASRTAGPPHGQSFFRLITRRIANLKRECQLTAQMCSQTRVQTFPSRPTVCIPQVDLWSMDCGILASRCFWMIMMLGHLSTSLTSGSQI